MIIKITAFTKINKDLLHIFFFEKYFRQSPASHNIAKTINGRIALEARIFHIFHSATSSAIQLKNANMLCGSIFQN
jgi:hypothetical protein